MFLQLVTPPAPPGPPPPALSTQARQCADSLFIYTPLQLSAIAETVWRNRYNAAINPLSPIAPFVPWPTGLTDLLVGPGANYVSGYIFDPGGIAVPIPLPQGNGVMPGGGFQTPAMLPGLNLAAGVPQPTNWDHMVYAYLVENTRIFDVFAKALELYMFTERLEAPSPAAQQFWRNTEYLLFGDGIPSMLWTTASRLRRDEVANRLCSYYTMFGADLSHAASYAASHPYEKAESANRDFIPAFEMLGSEAWQGIQNARNTSGPNSTDAAVLATLSRRIYDMMATRRLGGNLAREEFRAVALMSWMHLAVMYDSPAVQDLRATASSPEQRLAKMAERVGLTVHSRCKPLFDLAQPFSFLMQSIETGVHSTAPGAALLYTPGTFTADNAEVVVDQYTLATGRDLKVRPIGATTRNLQVPSAARLPAQARMARLQNGRAERQHPG